jgi:predicted HD phosphohydrolase
MVLDPAAPEPRDVVEEAVRACRSMVGLPYDGEPVDQLEHALQSAALAVAEHGDDDEFVIACLLHDIARAPAVAGMAFDDPDEHHGAAASRWLTPRFGARVAWLAEQHVAAKRYLVATDPAYSARLSEVSTRTLASQGGPMTAAEVADFRSNPDHRLAVQLRLIDDQAKVVGLEVAGVDAYRDRLRRVAGPAGA